MAIFDGDRDKLGAYVRHMADAMGLKDWDITVSDNPAPEDTNAHITCVYGQRRAIVDFDNEWPEWTREKLRRIAAHELVHCFLDQLTWPVSNVRNIIGQSLYDVTHEAIRDAIELATDGIATAWAETLPLPVTDAEHVEVGGEIERAA